MSSSPFNGTGDKAQTKSRWGFAISAMLLSAIMPVSHASAEAVTSDEINRAELPAKRQTRAVVARLQVLLDRARFSPGVIDGRMGENVKNALAAFRKENGLGATGEIESETWSRLNDQVRSDMMIVEYKLTQADVKGPFTTKIPEGLEEQKELERLGYRDPVEMIAEKFHMDEDFLKELNPGAEFNSAGTTIKVANVDVDRNTDRSMVKRLEVHTKSNQVRAFGADGKLIAVYPASVGSEERPALSGTHKVKGVAENPKYTYNPKYKFKGVNADKAFTIAAGPNNPVGSMWIDLSEDGYGIHGTPEPAEVGKTASHGCVRLTNWDSKSLAEIIRPGVEVEFKDL